VGCESLIRDSLMYVPPKHAIMLILHELIEFVENECLSYMSHDTSVCHT